MLETLSALVAMIQVGIQAGLAVIGTAGSSALQAEGLQGLDLNALAPPTAGYECLAPVWETEPQAKPGAKGLYQAAMKTQCKLYPSLGGDFKRLQDFSLEQLKVRGQILTGPIEEIHDSLPSLFVHYKLPIKTKKVEVTMWQDIHLATDGAQRFVSETASTKIEGKGMAEYLKRADVKIEIHAGAVAGEHEATVEFYSEMEKPWYAPESILISKLKELVPTQFAEVRDQFMSEASKNY